MDHPFCLLARLCFGHEIAGFVLCRDFWCLLSAHLSRFGCWDDIGRVFFLTLCFCSQCCLAIAFPLNEFIRMFVDCIYG